MASGNDEREVTLQDRIAARSAHVGVAGGKFMLIWGGYKEVAVGERYLDPCEINIYHIEHRYWTVHTCDGDVPAGTSGASASFVQDLEYVYVFGGHTDEGNTNCLYRLDLRTFTWHNLTPDDPEELTQWPSPRDKFSCWSYGYKLYVFGGFGPPLTRSLKDNGNFVSDTSTIWPAIRGWNDQLHEYDVRTGKWRNPKCKGSVPLPRAASAAVRLGSEVYLFGGRHLERRMNDLHCLNLDEYAWSGELHVEGACPCGRSWHSLTAASHDTAFLYGGYSNEGIPLSDAWQLNVTHRQWTQMTVTPDRCRLWHTGCCSDDSEILVFGGCCTDLLDYSTDAQHSNEVLSFHLKPYRLSRLCLEAVYQYRERLQEQWSTLPRDLSDWLRRHSEVDKLKSTRQPAVKRHKQGSTCTVS